MTKRQMCSGPVLFVITVGLGLGSAVAQSGVGGQQPQSPAGSAQPGGLNAPGSPDQMSAMNMTGHASMQDKIFLKQASEGDLFEIQAAQLALQKSSSDDVKQFAQLMIDDHTNLDHKMKPIAQEADVTPATSLSGKASAEYKKLQGLSGDAFDKEYIRAMVMDHSKVSKAFGLEASGGQLPDEKAAATENKPTVDLHLQKAQQLAQAHGVSMSGM